LETVYQGVEQASGIRFSFDHEEPKHPNSHTFYLRYAGPLPTENTVKVDVTIREEIVFQVEQRLILRAYEEFADLPPDRFIGTYSLDEIACEKTMALADRARNEPRDLYDLWQLVTERGVSLGPLADPICRKLRFRGKPCERLSEAILFKEARLQALWSSRLSHQMACLPPFEAVFRSVKRSLRQANLP
jgi:predicted nucleotidyltransferase component of viral defense system